MKFKNKVKAFEILIISGAIFWLLETVFFLILEGWHWEATSKAEIICDAIASIIMFFAWVFFILSTWELLKAFVKTKDLE